MSSYCLANRYFQPVGEEPLLKWNNEGLKATTDSTENITFRQLRMPMISCDNLFHIVDWKIQGGEGGTQVNSHPVFGNKVAK